MESMQAFSQKQRVFTSGNPDTINHLQRLSAFLSNICATSNVVYAEQLNLVSRIRRIVAFSDDEVGPQGASLDWNEKPLDASFHGGNRGLKGCKVSRDGYNPVTTASRLPCRLSCCKLSTGDSDYKTYLNKSSPLVETRDKDKGFQGSPQIFHVFTNCFPPSGTADLPTSEVFVASRIVTLAGRMQVVIIRLRPGKYIRMKSDIM